MNDTQVKMIVSLIVSAIGGILVAKGYLTNDQVSTLSTALQTAVGSIVVVASLIYTYYKTTATSQITNVAKLNEVTKIETTSTDALKLNHPKITRAMYSPSPASTTNV